MILIAVLDQPQSLMLDGKDGTNYCNLSPPSGTSTPNTNYSESSESVNYGHANILNLSMNANQILPETNNIVLENKSEPTVSGIGAVSVFEDPIINQRRATLQPNIKEIIRTDYREEEVLTSFKTNGKLDRHDANQILPETNNIVIENKSEPTVSEIGGISVFEDPIINQRLATLQTNIKEIIRTDYRGEEVLTSFKAKGKLVDIS